MSNRKFVNRHGGRLLVAVAALFVSLIALVSLVKLDSVKSDAAENWTHANFDEVWTCTYERLGTTYTVSAQPQDLPVNVLLLVPSKISADSGGSWGYVYPNGRTSGSTNRYYIDGRGTSTQASSAVLSKSDRALRITYTWGDFDVEQTMSVSDDGEIIHTIKFIYMGNRTFNGALTVSMDTSLNGTDTVSLYADGADGCYMIGTDYTLALNKVSGVETMYAGKWNENKQKGHWYSCTGKRANEVLVEGIDTATFYESPELSLSRGQSHTMSFKENTYKNDEFRVVLDGNGGTFDGDPTRSGWVKRGGYVTIDHTPTYPHYELAGWSTSRDGSTGMFTQSTTPITGNTTLYAQWEPIKHTVTFSPNGGTLSGSSTQSVADGGKATKPGNPTRTGYTFKGWYTAANGGSTFDFNGNITSDTTVYAQWTPITYSVAFNGNGSTGGSMSNQTMTYDVSTALTRNAFTKTGYTFAGWNTAANGSGTSYRDGQSVKNLASADESTVTLYAKWTANPQSLHYDKNASDATGTMSDTVGVTDAQVTVEDNAFTRTGYAFAGWNTKADGTGTDCAVGSKVTLPAGGMTLYAKWTANEYTIRFDGNDPSAAGSMSDMSMTYDVAKNLTKSTFSRAGYTFAGWSTEADGSGTLYSDGQSVKNLSAENDAVVTLYAKWTANVQSIRYHSNASGVTGTMPDTSAVTDANAEVSANKYVRTGYTFSSWNTSESGDGTDYESGASIKLPAGGIDLYAQWTPNEYEIEFHSNNDRAAGTMANLPMTYDMSKKLTKNAFTVSGYTFTGWNSQKDGSGTAYIDEQLVSNLSSQAGGHVDIYAQWRANAQEIRYHANADGVDGETESTSGVTDGTVSVEENGFTKTGYTFVNWNTKPTGDGTDYDAGDSVKLPAGGIDLYAKWSPNSYTISFVANHKSSNGSMPDMPMTYDVAKNLTRNAFTVPGYTFTGWNSKQDGSGTTYADAAEVKNLTATAGGNVKLYAQWKADSQSITYDKNADKATGETESTTGATDDTVEISGNGFTRTGYTFTGWNKSADGSGTAYKPSDDVVLQAGGITLYAQWKANTYTIRFDENHEGTTGKMGDMPMTYDVSKKLTKNAFSASGYTFTGWNTKANGSGTAYADAAGAVNLSATQDAVVTLYAQWRADPQEIRYHANIEGATGETDATAGVTDGTVEVGENGYEKVGYTFVGWNSDSDGDGSEYKVGSDVKLPAGGIDAYAQWAPNRYIIRFNGNHDGVTGEMPDQQMTYDVEDSLDMNAYVLHGYTFAGWSTKADGSGTDYTDGKKALNLASDNGAVIELYAQWTNDPQSIRYEINSDDGSGTTHETVGTTDGSVTVSDSDFDCPGYGFDGWNTQPDGSGDMYQPGDEAILPPGGLNFYAQWSPNTYTIRFDANHDGASGNMDDMMMTYDVAAKLTKNGYAVDGYTFVGWKLAEQGDDANDEANARTDDAVENADSDSDANVDADANDEGSADGTDVDGNETDGTSSDDAENATDDTANADNANTDNAADDGADASDDIIDFSDEEEVINLTTVDGGVVELDAVWSSSESRIVYDANLGGIVDDETGELVADAEHVDVADDTDGIGETPDTVGRTDEIVSVAENGFVNDGYHFVSWNTKADGTGDTFIPGDEFKLTAGATTLYAMWTNDPASITYDKNAPLATGTMEQTYGLIGQDVRIAENGFENLGFDFVEWNTEADGSGTAYAPGDEMTLVEHDVTLYAQWEASPVIVQTGAATGVGIAIAGIGGAVAYAVTKRKKKQRQ